MDLQTTTNTEDKTFEDSYNTYTRTTLFKATKSLYIILKIFGLFHYNDANERKIKVESLTSVNDEGKNTSKTTRKRKQWPSLNKIYCGVVFVLMLGFTLRLLTMFTYGDLSYGPELILKLCVMIWSIHLLINMAVLLRAAPQKLPTFILKWEQQLKSTQTDFEENMRKTTLKFSITSVFMVVFGTVLFFVSTILCPEAVEPLFAPLTADHPDVIITKIILLVFSPLLNAIWMLPAAVDFAISHFISVQFNKIKLQFNTQNMTESDFTALRKRHQKLCHLVHDADDLLTIYKVNSFLCDITAILFILYLIIYTPSSLRNTAFYAVNISWFTFTVVLLILNCLSGAIVNDAVS